MTVKLRQRRISGTLRSLTLSSDLSFSRRITGKYLQKKSRSSAMPRLIFRERAARFFSFNASILVTLPALVLKRYSLLNVRPVLIRGFGSGLRSPLRRPEPFGSSRSQGSPNVFFVIGSGTAASSGMPRGSLSSGTGAFHGSAGELSGATRFAAPREGNENPISHTGRYLFGPIGIRQMGVSRIPIASFADPSIRDTHRPLTDRKWVRLGKPGKDLGIRQMTQERGFPGTPVLQGVSEQGRRRVTERAGELFFRGRDRIEREIDELKRVIRRTETQIDEKVVRQVREFGATRDSEIDVRNLTLRVYRNMERMIRIEQERRGI